MNFKQDRKANFLFNIGIKVSMILFLFYALILNQSSPFESFFQYVISHIDSKTTGEIVISKPKKVDTNSYIYYIKYNYLIDEKKYQSSVINYLDISTDDYKKYLKKYTVGKTVVVYYDSKNPKYAILEKTELSYMLVIRAIALLMFSILIN